MYIIYHRELSIIFIRRIWIKLNASLSDKEESLYKILLKIRV